jgi:hypothetical protein
MLLIAVLAWVLPPATLGLLVWLVARSTRIGAAMKNATATGGAAAIMVLVFFDLMGIHRHGPWSEAPKVGWAWRVPMFASLTATFAWCSGWSAATLYLALRQSLRGLWGRPGCPSPMQTALAFLLLLGLVVFYVELAWDAARVLTDKRLIAAPTPAE